MIMEISWENFRKISLATMTQTFFLRLNDRIEVYMPHGANTLRSNIWLTEFTEEEYENILRDYLSDSMEIIRITNNPFNRKIPARIDILQDKEEKEEIPEIIDNAVEEITE